MRRLPRRAARQRQHLAEVAVRVRHGVEQVGLLADSERLAGEPLRLGMLGPAREHLRLHLPPEHLCPGVVTRAELRRAARPCLGLVESAQLVERLPEPPGRRRGVEPLSELVVQSHRF